MNEVYVLHSRDSGRLSFEGVFDSIDAMERYISEHHGSDYRRNSNEAGLIWRDYHSGTYEADLVAVQI